MSSSNQYRDFFTTHSKRLQSPSYMLANISGVENIFKAITDHPLMYGQAHYIFDYPTLSIIYQKGVKELLGYEEEEFTFELLTEYIHPDDSKRYAFIVESFVEYFEASQMRPFEAEISITARFRKKDGSYFRALRQSNIIETNKENIMTKSYSVISDISTIKKSNYVEWNCTSRGKPIKGLREFLEKKQEGYFTKREMEILRLLIEGKGSKEISEKLFVSKHTIDTHRRKMLAKSTCTNTIELIDFARKNSII